MHSKLPIKLNSIHSRTMKFSLKHITCQLYVEYTTQWHIRNLIIEVKCITNPNIAWDLSGNVVSRKPQYCVGYYLLAEKSSLVGGRARIVSPPWLYFAETLLVTKEDKIIMWNIIVRAFSWIKSSKYIRLAQAYNCFVHWGCTKYDSFCPAFVA